MLSPVRVLGPSGEGPSGFVTVLQELDDSPLFDETRNAMRALVERVDQLDQVALYWLNMGGGETKPLTVRVLGKDRDVPVAVVRGIDPAWLRESSVRAEVVRPHGEDLFR